MNHRRALGLFDEWLDLPLAEREQKLATLMLDDPELAAIVSKLLQADQEASGLLEKGVEPIVNRVIQLDVEDLSQKQVGPFQLQRLLGRGGMGEVWLAERTFEDMTQQVALKLLKRGMDSEALAARFLQERRILAELNHPHIAKLMDGGISEDGRLYYAMDYVAGKNLHEYLQSQSLNVRDRVQLMIVICGAVAHAQQHLVVHRDLKPSNIMIDENGQPRVLDFGIAKILTPDTDNNLTQTELIMLSPAYAAPEQILGGSISTATDVFSLGVILYEMLTGQLPQRRDAKNFDGLREQVQVAKIFTPSSLLKQRNENVEQLSNQSSDGIEQHTTEKFSTARYRREIAGDLDTIVMMALRPEPERRYANASLLAEDLQRWLEQKPVSAQPDTRNYRMRKFIARNRLMVGSASGVFLALIAGLSVALWQASVARQQANIARHEAARAERVRQFLISMFEEKEATTRARDVERTPLALVADGIARAKQELSADKELLSDVLGDLLEIQVNLGGGDAATSDLQQLIDYRRSRDPNSEKLAVLLATQINHLFRKGHFVEANGAVAEALRIYRLAYDEDDLRVADMQNRQVRILIAQTREQEALTLMQTVVAKFERQRGADDPDLGMRLSNLSVLQQRTGDLDAARSSLVRSIGILEKARGSEHAQLAFPLTNLGDLQRKQRDYEAALISYQRALLICRKQQGEQHLNTAIAWGRVGDMQRRLRRFDQAADSLQQALVIAERSQQNELMDIYAYLGRLAIDSDDDALTALSWFEKAYQQSLKTQGAQQRATWLHLLSVAELNGFLGRTRQAREAFERARSQLEALGSGARIDFLTAQLSIGQWERDSGNMENGIVRMQTAEAELRKLVPADHALLANAKAQLAVSFAVRATNADRAVAIELLKQIDIKHIQAEPYTRAYSAFARAQLAKSSPDRKQALAEFDAVESLPKIGSEWLRNKRKELTPIFDQNDNKINPR